jgi:LacI family transcriptional regulator
MVTNLRSVAAKAGVSVATASRALRGLPHVKPAVREAVARAARSLKYDAPPLVGAVLSHVRRGRERGGSAYTGTLAVLHVPGPGQPVLLPFQREVVAGARRRSGTLGFTLEVFELGAERMKPEVLGRVMFARGIAGVMVLHGHRTVELDGFPWDRFPAVELDYSAGRPALHTVCIDHHHTMGQAMMELAGRGYKRPGLVIERFKDERIERRWSAAFVAHVGRLRLAKLAPLVIDHWEAPAFEKWMERTRPDVVISHRDEAVALLDDRAGFFSLNWNERRCDVAGLDLRPQLQGEVAVEMVVARVQRNERGPPSEPRTAMVAGHWVEGPTVRGRGREGCLHG